MITFVITFRNEGCEVEATVKGLRDTCGNDVVIHLIDDASDDEFDYRSIAKQYNCLIERFDQSRGPAVNRNYGADKAKTPYVMFLDAHMRFYESNWHIKVIAAIDKDPEAIFCTRSKPLFADGEEHPGPIGHGAIASFDPSSPASYLHPHWNIQPVTHTDTPLIPVVLGATYAFHQSFFRRIGGYLGLKKYGGEEVFLSIKAWMLGGRCRLINDVTIGHIYRKSEDIPWRKSGSTDSHFFYNRLVTGLVTFPRRQFWHLKEAFQPSNSYPATLEAIKRDEGFIANLRDYVNSESVYDIEYFYELNRVFKNTYNLESYFSSQQRLSSNEKKLISIILPTYHNADLSVKCLNALKNHTKNDVFVIWIDNGSTDKEIDSVKQALAGLDYVLERHPMPLGFAKAVNKGIAHVIGDYCVILNNDVEVNEAWDVDLIRAVDDYPGLAGPLAVNSIGWQSSHFHSWLGIPGLLQSNNTHIGDWLRMHWSGKIIDIPESPSLPFFRDMLAFFCVLMPRHVLEDLGELDENFGWGYYEDDDYCRRARQRGYALSLCPGSSVTHECGKTLQLISDDHAKRLQRNAEYLALKWQNGHK